MDIRFVIIYAPGPAWIEGKSIYEQPLRDHAKYLLRLFKEKRLIMAGPFTDSAGGIAIIKVNSEKEAKDTLEHDPAVINKVLKAELHPWHAVFGGSKIERTNSILLSRKS